MEKDDENFSGAYDFGARILDSRLDRWMSMDGALKTQPQWSAYKAFKDCPVIYADPDGNSEFLTIIIRDQHGNSLKKTVLKSENVMSDAKVHKEAIFLFGKPWGEHHKHYYYDFETTVTYTIDDNGNLLSTETQTKILYENGIKDDDLVNTLDEVTYGETKDPDGFNNVDFQESGIHCTSEQGGASPVNNKNNGGESRDIGDFLTAVGKFTKDPSKMPDIMGSLGEAKFLKVISELKKEVEKSKKSQTNAGNNTVPQPGDSVNVETTKVTVHKDFVNGRPRTQESHSSGPTMKGVIPKDTTGGVFKGDKSLRVSKVTPLKK